MQTSKKNEDNSVKIGKDTTFKGDSAIGKGAKIIKNKFNPAKKTSVKEINWPKWSVIIGGIMLLIAGITLILYPMSTRVGVFRRP